LEAITLQPGPENAWMLVILAGVSVLAGLAGLVAAFLTYRQPEESWLGFEAGFGPVWGAWEEAYGVDDVYGKVIVYPGRKAAEAAAFTIDLPVIDGAVNGVGRLVRSVGDWARPLQTGFVRSYGALFLGGTVVVVIWLVAGS
jgi:NADH-quinone oxidoreductase subunit L